MLSNHLAIAMKVYLPSSEDNLLPMKSLMFILLIDLYFINFTIGTQ